MVWRVLALTGVIVCLMAGACGAQGEEAHVAAVKKYITSQILPWLGDAVVLDTVHARNLENSMLTDVDIERLDQEWKHQLTAPKKPLIDGLLNNELSAFLRKKIADAQGFIYQIIIMDAKGMNVGQGLITEDYWQGDEEKWQKGFKAPPGSMFIDEVLKYRSVAGGLTMQVSLPVTDPETGVAIGAITVFIDVDHLPAS